MLTARSFEKDEDNLKIMVDDALRTLSSFCNLSRYETASLDRMENVFLKQVSRYDRNSHRTKNVR